MPWRKNLRWLSALVLLSSLLGACGGGGGGDDDDKGSSNWDSMKWDVDDWARVSHPGPFDQQPTIRRLS